VESSVGWTVAISNGNGLMASLLPKETSDQIYQIGPDVIFAGSVRPDGTAELIRGGWVVNGRWPFASACQHADWIYGVCVMTESGRPLVGSTGEALVRGCFLPSRDWQIKNTWRVAGLRGTGSHDIELTDTLVPESHFFDLANGPKHQAGPLYHVHRPFLPLLLAASFVGMAAGALDEILKVANAGHQQLGAPSPMRGSEHFQSEIGRIGTEWKAAHCYLQAQATTLWSKALDGTLKTEPFFTQALQATVWIARACTGIAHACFVLGGGDAVYDSSGLQRRFRDLHVGAQHYMAQGRQYIKVGKLLLESGESLRV
jgi:indole-3-acetate monooxygenase